MEENKNTVENVEPNKMTEVPENKSVENKEKKKGGKAIVVIIVVVLLLAVAGVLAVCVPPLLKESKDNTPQQTEKEKEKEEVETELTDETIINDVKGKINYLVNTSPDGRSNSYAFRNGEVGDFGDFFNGYDDDLKLYIVLSVLYGEKKFHDLAPENESDPLISAYVQGRGAKDVKQISGEEVKKEYNNYFGTEQVSFDVLKPRMCFDFKYEPSKDIFYKVLPSCGGSSGKDIYNYNNKYTKKGNEVYVYVNYGVSVPEQDGTTSSRKVIIYKDLEASEQYTTVASYEEAANFRINAENYSEFSEYKYTFKKNKDGSYYYDSIEKMR